MSRHIGRAKTVLVLRDGEGDLAFITDVICRIVPDRGDLGFHGPGVFSGRTSSHLGQTVLEAVHSILSGLGLSCPGFMISAVNLGAASHDDRELVVSGFSADTAVFLSMLSAALGLPLPEDIVSTGHLASPEGDIRMVGALPAKLAAAEADPQIKTFILPDATKDDSLASILSEAELNDIEAAVAKAKRSLKLVPVSGISDLMRAAFAERDLVLAALRNGYFNSLAETDSCGSSSGQGADILAGGFEARFWTVLEQDLSAGLSRRAAEMIRAYLDHQIEHETYPPDMGRRLQQILSSLPPHVRRLKLRFPLVQTVDCIRLAQFAAPDQADDVTILLKAVQGDHLGRSIPHSPEPDGKEPEADDQKLETVLDLISAESLSERVTRPIDDARAAYQLDSVVVADHEAFNETITAFFIHLMRRVRGLIGPVEPELSGAEAHALLRRTFSRQGGYKGALAEARSGYKGGMRSILDAMTEQFKTDEREKEINRVLEEALDPLDWPAQVVFMSALIGRLKDHLPPEITNRPAERYAGHVQELTKAYMDSVDRLNSVFRSL